MGHFHFTPVWWDIFCILAPLKLDFFISPIFIQFCPSGIRFKPRRSASNGSNNGSHRETETSSTSNILCSPEFSIKKWRLLWKRPQNQVQNHWLNSVMHHEVVKVIFVLVERLFPLLALHPSFLSRYKPSSILWQVSLLGNFLTVFENHQNCRIWFFNFGIFH